MLGALRSGSAWCNINLRNTVEANIDILRRGHVRALFYSVAMSDMVRSFQEGCPELSVLVSIDGSDGLGTPLIDWIGGVDDGFVDFGILETDIGLQGTTSGTTGRPKLALNPHRLLSDACIGFHANMQYGQPPVNLAVAPISHAGCLIVLATLAAGGKTIMMSQPDPQRILSLVASEKVTTLFLPPTLIYMLLAQPNVREFDYSSLRYLLSAAAPFAPERIVEAVDVFGPVVAQAYGQTESGFPLTFMSPSEISEAIADDSLRHRLASCGRQSVIVERLGIVDDADNLRGPNETGEIVLKAQGSMIEYRDDPDATAELQRNGWLHTGDVGHIDDDGYLYITDRIRDMIISGGFNIFPFEIESVVHTLAEVQDCAAIGVPDPKWGEAVKVVVQLVPGRELSEATIIERCKERLGRVKAPKSVDFVDELPRNAAGKVLKRELAAPYWEETERRSS
jgi:fatty-acyl-CoA synthase